MSEHKINLDITEKFKSFIKNGEPTIYTDDEVYKKYKAIIVAELNNNVKAITSNIENLGNFYILSLSFGQTDFKFKESISINSTFLDYIDEYQDEIKFMIKDGRPIKIRELYHENKGEPQINDKTKRVCKKCGNTNRDVAIYCDMCGNKL